MKLEKELIEIDKINEMLRIHKILFYRFIKSKDIELSLKNGVLRYYTSFISNNNIENYYNLPMKLFFNELYKTI